MRLARAAALVVVLLLVSVGATGALAAAKPDFTGHWSIIDHCIGGGCSGRDFYLEEDLVQSGGKLTGSGGYVVDGSVSGASASFTATGYGGYVATFKVTMSSDGKTLKGTASDTQGQTFTITGQRAGGTVTAPATPAPALDPTVAPNLCAFKPSCDGIGVRTSGKPKLNSKTGQLAKLTADCYSTRAGGTAAAHATQTPAFTCGASAEAILSDAGDAEIDALLDDAQKLLASGNRKDQLQGQKLVAQANKRFGQIAAALKASGELAASGIDLDFDEALAKAQKLLTSPNKKDQLLGQKLVEQTKQRLQSEAQSIERRSEQVAQRVNSSSVRKHPALTIAAASVKVAGGKRGTLTLRAGRRQLRVLSALRRAGLRSVTLRLQLGGSRSGDAESATTRTTLKVALR